MIWQKEALPFFQHNFETVLLIGNAYLFAILWYTQFNENVEPSKRGRFPYVKQMERMWNLASTLFSGIVFWGCWTNRYDLLSVNLADNKLAENYSCQLIYWIFLYCATKPLELIDTFLLMMQGKNIHMLHWSHHIITLLYTWQSAREMHPSHILFAVVNLFVHWIMYFYYFCASFPSLRVHRIAFVITILQISQFVFCLGSIIYHASVVSFHQTCLSGAMYFYYFIMFLHMYNQKYKVVSTRKVSRPYTGKTIEN